MKYTDELKARAVELVIHAQADPDTANGAITRVANELGLIKEALRIWVRKHKDSGKATPAESVDLEAENRRLRAELAEAKRANEILKRASAYLPRRSSTAHRSDCRLHRRLSSRVRHHTNRARPVRGCGRDCCELVLRVQVAST
ncbi:transposase [Brevibacterium linens]|uniref:transposase n=1 Tax=Brevibacterium linens TaxID=1703 RepID=UPI003F8AE73A